MLFADRGAWLPVGRVREVELCDLSFSGVWSPLLSNAEILLLRSRSILFDAWALMWGWLSAPELRYASSGCIKILLFIICRPLFL